jgi:hypothetical protein
MAALTGVSQTTFFQHFSKIDDAIGNAALTQEGDKHDSAETNALREHINALNAANPGEQVPPAQPLPIDLPVATEVPDQEVARYVERLRMALWFIVQCGGTDQALFVLEQAAKSFPSDTTPAFKRKQ